MKIDSIRVRARIELISTEEGGRDLPIVGTASYRPNHNFLSEQNKEMALGVIQLDADQTLSPGEETETELTIVVLTEVVGDIQTGRRWRIQEGSKLVGMGTVLEVLAIGEHPDFL